MAIEDAQIVEALELGARGVVLKEAATELLLQGDPRRGGRAVLGGARHRVRHRAPPPRARRFGRGKKPSPADGLTPREREIVAAVAAGDSEPRDRAAPRPRRGHRQAPLSNIFDKLGVSNRAELAAYATSHGLACSPRLPPNGPDTGQ